MNTLTEAIHDYVGMRQSLGFKLLQVEAYLLAIRNKPWVGNLGPNIRRTSIAREAAHCGEPFGPSGWLSANGLYSPFQRQFGGPKTRSRIYLQLPAR